MKIKSNGTVINFTPTERFLVLIMMGRKMLPMPEAVDLLYPDPDDEPEIPENVIRVHMVRIRKKLKAVNSRYSVQTNYRWGYGLVDA